MKLFIVVASLILSSSSVALAAGGGGGHSLGGGLILASPTQNDLNTVIDQINTAQSISVDKLGTGYELAAFYQYRFSGSMFALQFRPTYFMQSSSGDGYEASLKGFTFFPMLRLYPLENNFIHFFLQTGVGYGRISGELSGANGSVEWSGGAFGASAGLGAEFCFVPAHCVVIEGNVRYLPIERNIISSASSNPGFTATPEDGQELENNNMDVKTTLSGIQGGIFYHLYF